MKTNYKNIIFIISIVCNIIAAAIIKEGFETITEMTTITNKHGLLDSHSSQKETLKANTLTDKEYVDALYNLVIDFIYLKSDLKTENFESYKKRSRKMIEVLNNVIASTKDEKFKKELIFIKKTITGRPKKQELEHLDAPIDRELPIYRKKYRQKERDDFYNGK